MPVLPKIRYAYPIMMKLDILAKKDPRICKTRETLLEFCKCCAFHFMEIQLTYCLYLQKGLEFLN